MTPTPRMTSECRSLPRPPDQSPALHIPWAPWADSSRGVSIGSHCCTRLEMLPMPSRHEQRRHQREVAGGAEDQRTRAKHRVLRKVGHRGRPWNVGLNGSGVRVQLVLVRPLRLRLVPGTCRDVPGKPGVALRAPGVWRVVCVGPWPHADASEATHTQDASHNRGGARCETHGRRRIWLRRQRIGITLQLVF